MCCDIAAAAVGEPAKLGAPAAWGPGSSGGCCSPAPRTRGGHAAPPRGRARRAWPGPAWPPP
eukprot:3126860-Pyramimonas_sp.AAC.1